MAKREDVVKQAQEWLGRNENDGTHKYIIDVYNANKPLPRGYAVQYDDEWCATFVTAVAIKCGAIDIIPKECSCSRMIKHLQLLGSWMETDSYVPSPGDLIFYDWQDKDVAAENRNAPEHVGIVEKVESGVIVVIEGNYSKSVKRRYLKINGKYIRGFGLPKYETTTNKEVVTEEQTPEKLSLEEVAKEVIQGKWGTGLTRKMNLEANDYNYQEVQAEVNRILKGKKTNEEIAREVIRGKWGSGLTRRVKLVAAGYNYNEVQRIVNILLK